MPQGEGTYGTQKGRPPKKIKKYQEGGAVVPNFPMENEAIEDANKMGQELKSISLENFPTSNAPDRMERQPFQLGGAVQPPTTPSIVPNKMLTPGYKKGGKVN